MAAPGSRSRRARAAVRHGLRSPWRFVAASAIGVGFFLRSYQLPMQILLDDEWHAVHKLISSSATGIVTSFGLADYSIPLTLYYRFLAVHGGLTEWQMHLPMLLAGVSLVVVAPWLLRHRTSGPVLAAWMLLLAISPLLVYLSRTARPYALTCLLAFVAVIAFRRWWQAGGRARRYAALYVASAVLGGWLHLITLPFTLLPLVHATISTLRAGRPRELRRIGWLAVVTLLPLAALLAPPLIDSAAQLAQKSGSGRVSLESAWRSALMMFGIASSWLLVACIAACALGIRRFWRRDAGFVGYVAFCCAGAAIAIVLARPQWIEHPLVFSRYMLPALPFVLLFMAEGAMSIVGNVPVVLAVPIVALCAAGLFVAGPIPGYLYRPNQFMGHQRFQFDYDPAHNPYVLEIPKEPIPAFYRELALQPPRTLTLIEAPWRLESNFDPFPWYQQVHRQYVKIGLVTPVCGVRDFGDYPASVTQLRFRNFVHLSDLLEGRVEGGDYLVMHLKPWKTPPDAEVEWPDVAACLPGIAAKLGVPVYRDDNLAVFDLSRRASRH